MIKNDEEFDLDHQAAFVIFMIVATVLICGLIW